MKKILASVLVTLLLLNVMGYYFFFLGAVYTNNTAMIRKLDANRYDENNALVIKIPITIAYLNDSREFERVDGIFEHEGEFYRLVKQKYAQDTLTIVCVRDHENKKIQEALEAYVQTFTQDQPDQSSTKSAVSFIKDYFPSAFTLKNLTAGWFREIDRDDYREHLIPTFTSTILHPPEHG